MSVIQNNAIDTFIKLFNTLQKDDDFQETNWFDFAVGYFIATGFEQKTAVDLAGELQFYHKVWTVPHE